MQSELLLQFSVLRGLQLPKTELTSKIDAYVKVKAGAFSAKTKTKVQSLTSLHSVCCTADGAYGVFMHGLQ